MSENTHCQGTRSGHNGTGDKHDQVLTCGCCDRKAKAEFAILYSIMRDGIFPDATVSNGWFPDAADLVCEKCAQEHVEGMGCMFLDNPDGTDEFVDLSGEYGGKDDWCRLPHEDESLLPTPQRPVIEYSIHQALEKWTGILLTPELVDLIHRHWEQLAAPQGQLYVDYLGYVCADYTAVHGYTNWLSWQMARAEDDVSAGVKR